MAKTCKADSKAQWIRLADVFAIGPLMTYGGCKLANTSKVPGAALAILGVLTVVYNGYNYLKAKGFN